MIPRIVENKINNRLFKGKAILVYGARQTGKTTLVNKIIENYRGDTLSITGDDPRARIIFNNMSLETMTRFIRNNRILFIDEAQRFDDIGLAIKLIVDHTKDIQVF